MNRGQELAPIRLVEVELAEPLPDLSAAVPERYERILVLVRLHTQPLGRVELRAAGRGLAPDHYAEVIWSALRGAIQQHLQQDALPPCDGLGRAGLPPTPGLPGCLRARERFLAEAPFATVVVPTRDRPQRVATCLQSLLRLAYPRFEIVVVDSAPTTSATHDLIQRRYADCTRVRYCCAARAGASRARNLGLQMARGEVVAFLDDDVIVDTHWLTELTRELESSPTVACVTGGVLPAELDTSSQIWFEEFGGFFKGFARKAFDVADNRCPDALYPYLPGAFGTGASMAFRRSILRRLGGFDEALGPSTPTRGGEDLAVFLQLVTDGYQLVYQPAALSYHLHRRDYPALKTTMYGYGVGLSALLVRHLANNPGQIGPLLRRLPGGLHYLLSPASRKNSRKTRGYPRQLSVLELAGVLVGPFAYGLSRYQNKTRAMFEARPAWVGE